MMGGRSACFPLGGAPGGGGYNTLEQQRMSQTTAALAFAAARCWRYRERIRPVWPPVSGTVGVKRRRDRPSSGGSFSPNGSEAEAAAAEVATEEGEEGSRMGIR
jgi:hypothetical protein